MALALSGLCAAHPLQECILKQRAEKRVSAPECDSSGRIDWSQKPSRDLCNSVNQGFSWATPADASSVTQSDYIWRQEELEFMRQVSSLWCY